MTTTYNDIFKQLLTEYNIPVDFSFNVNIPTEIQNILDSQILTTEFGITLKTFNKLRKSTETWETKSIIEDEENHFHVEWYIEPSDNKEAFKLGVKTLVLLAEKFQKEKINDMRFWFSFQTPELGIKSTNRPDEEHFISDRLSFYKRRENEEVVNLEIHDESFCAMLIIDI